MRWASFGISDNIMFGMSRPPSFSAVNLSAAPPGLEIILRFNPRLNPLVIVGRLVRLSTGVNTARRHSHFRIVSWYLL